VIFKPISTGYVWATLNVTGPGLNHTATVDGTGTQRWLAALPARSVDAQRPGRLGREQKSLYPHSFAYPRREPICNEVDQTRSLLGLQMT